MTALLDQLQASWGGRTVAGPDANVLLRIEGAPEGKLAYGMTLSAGSVSVSADGPKDAALVVTIPAAIASAWIDGDLDLAVAYMRGDAKIEGEPGPVIELLRSLSLA